MKTFTLDTNCLLDVDEGRDAAPFVKKLVEAARDGKADVAMVASSASERQKDDSFLDNIRTFKERMGRVGFGHLEILPTLAIFGFNFLDNTLIGSDDMENRENLIYKTMFPTSPAEWVDYAAAAAVEVHDRTSRAHLRWRNQILDAQAFWAHDFHGRDVFVTSDRRFQRLEGAPEFPNALVRAPHEAVALL